jgi:hypothetical protein
MYKLNKKHLFIVIISALFLFSCKTQNTFSGTERLDCPSHEPTILASEKKKSKWRLILYKNGEKVWGKNKRGKSKLFKND